MSPKTTSEWEKEFDEKFVSKLYNDYGKIVKEQFKFYNIKTNKFFELETIENEFCPPFLIKSFISTLIAQKQKEVLDYLLSIHQKLESEYCGSITDIKLGIKSENPHTFVIEIIQTAKEKFNINL